MGLHNHHAGNQKRDPRWIGHHRRRRNFSLSRLQGNRLLFAVKDLPRTKFCFDPSRRQFQTLLDRVNGFRYKGCFISNIFQGGQQLSDVQSLLTEAGLTLGTVTENDNADGEKGKIISQSLTAKQKVDRDTQIDFVVVGEKVAEEEKPAEEKPVEETPEATETPGGTTPAETSSSKSFTVTAPASYVNEKSISVKILKISNGSPVEVAFNETRAISDFPFDVTLSGSGQAEVQLYIDNVYQWSQIVNFSEGAN